MLASGEQVSQLPPGHHPAGAAHDGRHGEVGADLGEGEVAEEVEPAVVGPREAGRVPAIFIFCCLIFASM